MKLKKDKIVLSKETLAECKKLQRQGYKMPPLSLIKSNREIKLIKESAEINTALLDFLDLHVKEGITTAELDKLAYDFTVSHGAIPAPLHYEGFPNSICTSVNNVVCHGIPDDYVLKNGDIINLDVSTIYNGYFSDASRLYIVGGESTVTPEVKEFVDTVRNSVKEALKVVKPFATVNDIGNAIDAYIKPFGYGIVRELGGHGIGLEFHEDPFIYHYHRIFKEMILVPGMIFTIEPMINMGKRYVVQDEEDGWTIYTKDGSLSGQVEHMILVTKDGYEILSC